MKTYLLFYLKINWLPCKRDLRIHSAEKNEKIVRMWHFSSKTTISSLLMLRYRMSHEIWQLIKFYKCRLLYTVLDSTGFLLWNQFFYNMTPILFLFLSLVSKNLSNYGRRHCKIFTHCHVCKSNQILSFFTFFFLDWLLTVLEIMKNSV